MDFGTSRDVRKAEEDPFLVALDVALTTKDLGAQPLLGPLHRKRWRQRQAAIKSLHHGAEKIMEDRIAGRSKALTGDKDVLDLMLAVTDPETGERMDKENIRNNLILFLLVGHDSTSSLLTSVLYLLTQHPEVEEKLRTEVLQVMGSSQPTYDNIKRLTYMNQVLRESLRLYPPAGGIVKTCIKDTTLGPYTIKAGTRVAIMIKNLHHNPAVWGDDHDEFNPDRFASSDAPKRHSYAWIPFSSGPRACLGMQFSMIEARVVLAKLIQTYTFRLNERSRVHQKTRTFTKLKDVYLTAHDHTCFVGAAPKVQENPPAACGSAVACGDEEIPVAALPRHSTPLSIIWGGNMGTCKAQAARIALEAADAGFEVQVMTLNEATSIETLQAGLTLIVTSTYNGQPPENARGFAKWATEALMPGSLAGGRCSVLGIGNSNWKSYQAFPEKLEKLLKAAGAHMICPRGEANEEEDVQDMVDAWRADFWPKALEAVGQDAKYATALLDRKPAINKEGPALRILPASPGTRPSFPVLDSAYRTGTVTKSYELQAGGSGRSTRHVEIRLPTGMTYSAGDHLAVLPQNHPDAVLKVADRLNADLHEVVELNKGPGVGLGNWTLPFGSPVTVHDLLTRFVDLQAPVSVDLLEAVAASLENEADKNSMRELAEFVQHSKRDLQLRLLDILDSFPSARITLEQVLPHLSPMVQRYYSISSAPREVNGAQVAAITVGLVQGTSQSNIPCANAAERPVSRMYVGVASGFLAQMRPGQAVEVMVCRNHRFRLPGRGVPVVMVGPGTGLAPFRGFIQAMKDEGGSREAALFFGCRTADDYIYREELEAALRQGILTDLHVAFSRLTGEKVYVQDKLWEARERVWEMLKAGGRIYVCGDARSMAKDVDSTLIRIAKECGDMSAPEAEQLVLQLSAEERYLQDVWAN